MPILGTFLGGVITWLATFFAGFITKKFAVVLAVVAVIAGLTGALIISLNTLMQTLTVSFPGGWFETGFSVLPENTNLCASTYFSAKLAKWVYDTHIETIKLALS